MRKENIFRAEFLLSAMTLLCRAMASPFCCQPESKVRLLPLVFLVITMFLSTFLFTDTRYEESKLSCLQIVSEVQRTIYNGQNLESGGKNLLA